MKVMQFRAAMKNWYPEFVEDTYLPSHIIAAAHKIKTLKKGTDSITKFNKTLIS
jgi:hypothetical protein